MENFALEQTPKNLVVRLTRGQNRELIHLPDFVQAIQATEPFLL
jgi:hypothetical protein